MRAFLLRFLGLSADYRFCEIFYREHEEYKRAEPGRVFPQKFAEVFAYHKRDGDYQKRYSADYRGSEKYGKFKFYREGYAYRERVYASGDGLNEQHFYRKLRGAFRGRGFRFFGRVKFFYVIYHYFCGEYEKYRGGYVLRRGGDITRKQRAQIIAE